jgi:peptide/nickel transport system ATP-binding protein
VTELTNAGIAAISDASAVGAAPSGTDRNDVLVLRDVTISLASGAKRTRPLVTGLDLSVGAGEVVAIVGESGSGKSITALACMGLLPQRLSVTSGEIVVAGTSVLDLEREAFRRLRGTEVAMIFQDPMASLDPCFSIGSQIMETVLAHRDVGVAEARRLTIEMLELVEIPNAKQRLGAFPHEFSGGMRQRVMIAAALVLRPKLLLADEPTTALDVTTQASILALVKNLRHELGMSVLWISHDLGVIADVADRVAVMYAGELIEQVDTSRTFGEPAHPYTRGLIASSKTSGHGVAFGFVPGSVPEPAHWPTGCRFQPRCERAIEECAKHPALRVIGAAHECRCVNPYVGARS